MTPELVRQGVRSRSDAISASGVEDLLALTDDLLTLIEGGL